MRKFHIQLQSVVLKLRVLSLPMNSLREIVSKAELTSTSCTDVGPDVIILVIRPGRADFLDKGTIVIILKQVRTPCCSSDMLKMSITSTS